MKIQPKYLKLNELLKGQLFRMVTVALMCGLSAPLLGCGEIVGLLGAGGGVLPPDKLPDPDVWRVDPPVRTAEEQVRQDEVDRFLFERYQAEEWRILATTQTYGGDIVDWLDPESVPGSFEEPPPVPELVLPEGVELQTAETEAFPELRGPAGSIAMVRPSFATYVRGESGATSLDEFLQNQEGGQPVGQKRLYAGLPFVIDNVGASAWINQYPGDVEARTFSLIELAVICRGDDEANTMEVIGAVASRDKANFGDAVVRLQAEFFTAGPRFLGDDKGGWDGPYTGLVPAAGRLYGPGIALGPLSSVNGTQYASFISIQLLGGNWWLAHNGTWIGHYPGHLFKQMSQKGTACEADWYGEVFDPTPTDWTATDIGSGQFGSSGFGQAAFVRRPVYFDTAGVTHYPTDPGYMPPIDPLCYTRTALDINVPEPEFFLGGPGGDAPGCD